MLERAVKVRSDGCKVMTSARSKVNVTRFGRKKVLQEHNETR